MLFSLIITADIDQPLEFQRRSMQQAFLNVEGDLADAGEDFSTICRMFRQTFWIRCVDGAVQQVWVMDHFTTGNYRIGFFPNTVEVLEIASCDQTFAIETRHFPPNVRLVNLRDNRIIGCPNLQALPRNLQHLTLNFNKLSGKIALVGLPATLKSLHLSYNTKLGRMTTFYSMLPKSLETISLAETGVRYLKALRKDDRLPENCKVIGPWFWDRAG